MISALTKTEETAPQPTPLQIAEAELRTVETEHAEIAARIEGLKSAPRVARLSDEERAKTLPVVLERAAPFIGIRETKRRAMLDEALEREPGIRDRLVAVRGKVARMRQSEASRKAAMFRDQYLTVADQIAEKLIELEALLIEETGIRTRAHKIAGGRNPLPNLSIALGARTQKSSPIGHWFSRYRAATKG